MSQESQPNSLPNGTPKEKVLSEDLDFFGDCKTAFLEEKMPYANVLLLTIAGIVVAFFIWASNSRVSEIARGQGKVIPSASLQIIQSLEGGIVSQVHVAEGQFVEQGQLLVKVNDMHFNAAYNESLFESNDLLAKIARLNAESNDLPELLFPEGFNTANSELIASETLLFKTRRENIETQQERLQKSLALKNRELSMTRPLADSGVVSQVELLRLETLVNDIEGQLEREWSDYKSEVVSQNNEYKTRHKQIEETLLAYKDKIYRTSITAPISGFVNKVHIKTLGGVLQPGAPIIEIVPNEDSLLVQADISPSDIAFISLQQEATVKLTAYDFSIYGGLNGTVEHISADTFLNEKGESFYKILVRTGDRSLQTSGQELKIIPGMVAQVDIKTGKKSVLDYVLKPLMRAKMNAFTER
ncbi:MAG: HlyD family efflux transporter periplasmic adaptor subunit [Opitutales bacterium]|nr:HlyD family efflux transporter periplasmic adaptor subunit [Opitutales bacterium]